MFRKASELQRYTIRAHDGDLGSVQDLYFDDDSWTVRYFVVDTGGWLSGRRVLIAPEAVEQPDWPTKELPVNLTRQQVQDAPDVNTEKPVSRQQEDQYRAYYAWPPYWGGAIAAPSLAVAYPPAVSPEGQPGMTNQEQELNSRMRQQHDPNLRSVNEVEDYKIEATDGEIGHVEDFFVDDMSWQIRYMLVDTRDWLPGKDVLVPPEAVRSVLWVDRDISVDAPKQTIESAPEFDSSRPLGRDYEAALYSHFGLTPYWQRT